MVCHMMLMEHNTLNSCSVTIINNNNNQTITNNNNKQKYYNYRELYYSTTKTRSKFG